MRDLVSLVSIYIVLVLIAMFAGILFGMQLSEIHTQSAFESVCRGQYNSYDDVIACYSRASHYSKINFIKYEIQRGKESAIHSNR